MKRDRADTRMAELLEAARPEMSEGWEGRACEAVGGVKPARRWSARRMAVIALGAAALVGLGFVPIPMGPAPGALERAMAAAEGIRGVYLRYEGEERGKKSVFEVWQGPGGLRRSEMRENDELVSVSVRGRDMGGFYDAPRKEAYLFDTPPPLDWYTGLPSKDLYERTRLRDRALSEWREETLWGGSRDVVEVEDGPYLHHYEFESESGRLLSEALYQAEGGSWRYLNGTTDVVWDVELPEDTWGFDPPPGTTVHWNRWWVGRTEDVIAEGENEDWYVRLHAIDMDRDGDLYLTLSRTPKPHRQAMGWNGGGPIDIVSAVDNVGTRYDLENGCSCVRDYWARRLSRGSSRIPVGIAKTVTLVIQPYDAGYAVAQGEEPGGLVTLENVPLPRPQDSDDLFADREEVIQY